MVGDGLFSMDQLAFLDVSNAIRSVEPLHDIKEFFYKNTGQLFSYCNFESLEFKLSPGCLVLGVLGLMGPFSPLFVQLSCGSKQFKFRNFDRNCFYTRPQTFSSMFVPEHDRIVLSALPDQPDFTVCAKAVPEFELPRVASLMGVYVVPKLQ